MDWRHGTDEYSNRLLERHTHPHKNSSTSNKMRELGRLVEYTKLRNITSTEKVSCQVPFRVHSRVGKYESPSLAMKLGDMFWLAATLSRQTVSESDHEEKNV
ncbi:hypothetical protein BaRGS_00039201 [Batillaria attramentaria]|uniref:Uncharacterized protein n=1 Tax=Batillaria attramentaria TaxID=370345 RepID=A0ABD0J3N5_9CAEN